MSIDKVKFFNNQERFVLELKLSASAILLKFLIKSLIKIVKALPIG